MRLHDLLVKQGGFLFRWRSFVPLLLIIPALAALSHSEVIEDFLGDTLEDIVVLASFLVSIAGLGVRWYTVGTVPPGTSGRNTQAQRADVLNTTGMYSIVRNPLYLGNFIVIFGVLLSLKVWWFVLIGAMAYWIYIERIIATEERFLSEKFGDAYMEWAMRIPIFIPDLKLWVRPEVSLNIKKILRSEYNGLMVVSLAFFMIEFFADILFEKEPFFAWLREDWIWSAQFIVCGIIFVTLRYMKKHTKLLNISPGNG